MDMTLDYRRRGRSVYTDIRLGVAALEYDYVIYSITEKMPAFLQDARVEHSKPHADIWT